MRMQRRDAGLRRNINKNRLQIVRIQILIVLQAIMLIKLINALQNLLGCLDQHFQFANGTIHILHLLQALDHFPIIILFYIFLLMLQFFHEVCSVCAFFRFLVFFAQFLSPFDLEFKGFLRFFVALHY